MATADSTARGRRRRRRSRGKPRRAGQADLSASRVNLPEAWCDRWHHCSIAQGPRDYTNGLGPSSRKRQETTLIARLGARFVGVPWPVISAASGAHAKARRTVSDGPTAALEAGRIPSRREPYIAFP